ncbi:MAG TPA: Crp/Fnr family transcriptional regulator, partial [Candidatus Sulfotelmatobacter sp.]|nr:Crp/Fnr family transcriptional regulator [Candidatus Sulfotelmatobacter sp.]
MIDNVQAVLRKTPLFASLTREEVQALAARTSRRRLQRGELLFGEGDPCTGLFVAVALSGTLGLLGLAAPRSATGREQVLALEGPGSSFAELPVFDGGNYPAAAAASEDAELLFISRKDFQNVCREHPDVALKVIAVVGGRLRRLVGIIEELSFTTVRQRLIALLLQLAEAEGTRAKDGIH